MRIRRIAGLRILVPEPKRVSSKYPAIILAVKKRARVKGRMIKLIDTIITINGINIKGVPKGIK